MLIRQGTFRILALSVITVGSFDAARCQVAAPVAVSENPQVIGADAATVSPAPEVKFNLPHVTCKDGELTISANSSNMRSVLAAIQSCLGISIEAPASLSYEPVFVELGPGPVNRILSDFLSLTDLNFVVVSAEGDPSAIVKVELSSRSSEGEKGTSTPLQATEQMSPARAAWMATRNIGRGMPPPESESAPTSDQPQPVSPEAAADAKETAASSAPAGQPASFATTTAVEVAAATPAAPAANQTPAADNGLQNQITDMQRLFEERKKINGNTPDPKAGTATPSVSSGPDTAPPSP